MKASILDIENMSLRYRQWIVVSSGMFSLLRGQEGKLPGQVSNV